MYKINIKSVKKMYFDDKMLCFICCVWMNFYLYNNKTQIIYNIHKYIQRIHNLCYNSFRNIHLQSRWKCISK